jgi:hypothetical protein
LLESGYGYPAEAFQGYCGTNGAFHTEKINCSSPQFYGFFYEPLYAGKLLERGHKHRYGHRGFSWPMEALPNLYFGLGFSYFLDDPLG